MIEVQDISGRENHGKKYLINLDAVASLERRSGLSQLLTLTSGQAFQITDQQADAITARLGGADG